VNAAENGIVKPDNNETVHIPVTTTTTTPIIVPPHNTDTISDTAAAVIESNAVGNSILQQQQSVEATETSNDNNIITAQTAVPVDSKLDINAAQNHGTTEAATELGNMDDAQHQTEVMGVLPPADNTPEINELD
jgi:hypothetical protein